MMSMHLPCDFSIFLLFCCVSVKLAENADNRCFTSPSLTHVASIENPSKQSEDVYEGLSSPSVPAVRRNGFVKPRHRLFADVSTLTEIVNAATGVETLGVGCESNTSLLPEVDLVSLLEERLPRYRLRADALTDFAGYANSDWIVQTPCLAPDDHFDLSPDFIDETLKYFVLSSERLTQMTRTYNDVAAVTLLLEEKERDLELAARIGQKLLTDNNSLRHRNDFLEEQLAQATDRVAQLRHVITVKDALLQVYTAAADDPDSPSPQKHGDFALATGSATATIDVLQRRVRSLEQENLSLKVESEQLSSETEQYEEREAGLVQDCVRELRDTAERLGSAHDELCSKTEQLAAQNERLALLSTKICKMDSEICELTNENSELHRQLEAMKQTQKELIGEVMEWEDKYGECLELLHNAQDEIRELQRAKKPPVVRYHCTNETPYLSGDSLAIQLENSVRRSLLDHDESQNHSLRVMHTARAVNKSKLPLNLLDSFNSSSGLATVGSEPADAVDCAAGTEAATLPADNHSRSLRLSMDEKCDDESYPECHSPESYLSTGSAGYLSAFRYRLPEKLQIVKPIEGSRTLHKWRALATPHLGGVLEHRPGVQVKGQRLDSCFEEEVYSVSDYEEDDDYSLSEMMKNTEMTSSTFTFTVSKITHPSTNYTMASTVMSRSWSIAGSVPSPRQSINSPLRASTSLGNTSAVGSARKTFGIDGVAAASDLEKPTENGDTDDGGKFLTWFRRWGLPTRLKFYGEMPTASTASGDGLVVESSPINSSVDGFNGSMTTGPELDAAEERLGLGATASRYRVGIVTRAPTDVGLNTVMSLKRSARKSQNAALVANRVLSQKLQTIGLLATSTADLDLRYVSSDLSAGADSTQTRMTIPSTSSIFFSRASEPISSSAITSEQKPASVAEETYFELPSILLSPEPDLMLLPPVRMDTPPRSSPPRSCVVYGSSATRASTPARRPQTLDVIPTLSPLPRSACTLTSSLSTVVHCRVSDSFLPASVVSPLKSLSADTAQTLPSPSPDCFTAPGVPDILQSTLPTDVPSLA